MKNQTPRQEISIPREPVASDPEFEILSQQEGHIPNTTGLEGSNPHRY